MPPSVNIRFAALANADSLGLLGAILAGDLFLAVSHAGRLAALGADQHHVGGVNGAFLLEDAALLALTAGLLVLATVGIWWIDRKTPRSD